MTRRAHRLRYLLPAAALVVTLAGGGFAALETDTAGSFGAGVWWALSLVTTVGFVGQTPVTTGGRLLAAALMLFGFALLSLTTAALASLFVREDETPAEQRDAAFESQVLRELQALHERLDRMERLPPPRADPPLADVGHIASDERSRRAAHAS
jgi:voltage-gated potassium channel